MEGQSNNRIIEMIRMKINLIIRVYRRLFESLIIRDRLIIF